MAGSNKKPEVRVFVQTNTRKMPLDLSKLRPKQTVWMKWSSGPIVGKSKILSWHSGMVEDGNLNELRNLTVGTELFGLDKYWENVSRKENFYFVVVRLTKEEWLERLIYPTAKSYRSSWVYLENKEQKKLWLSNYVAPEPKNDSGRNIPVGTRFDVFRRDNFTCIYCGRRPPEVELHVDHKVPWKVVKKHEMSNLFTACAECNLGKKDKLI